MPHTDSEPAEATLTTMGVWLHDPADPDGTARNYLYGKATRSTEVDAGAVGTSYAGREYPVLDYGEHSSEAVGCTIEVPHGPLYAAELGELRAFADTRGVLVFRDNRGRAVHGGMTGFKIVDQGWGSQVSFTITRADYQHETVT